MDQLMAFHIIYPLKCSTELKPLLPDEKNPFDIIEIMVPWYQSLQMLRLCYPNTEFLCFFLLMVEFT